MSNTNPIKLYIDSGAFHEGEPKATIGHDGFGDPVIRIRPAGISGPYMSISPSGWDALAAVVAEARAEYAASRLLGELPSTHLVRTFGVEL